MPLHRRMTLGSVSSSASWSLCSSEIHILMRVFQSIRDLAETRWVEGEKNMKEMLSHFKSGLRERKMSLVYVFIVGSFQKVMWW